MKIKVLLFCQIVMFDVAVVTPDLTNGPIRAYLPDVRAFGLGGPRDDARHGQARLTGVHEICGVHLSSQRLDVLQDGHLDLARQQSSATSSTCRHTERPRSPCT